ncbi:hypothetical protein V1512DRAFT_263149, partial [Lipomyces arxii]|uniref:uncharacterized protein n=1 Tax=Lipomyces arxii TaxID=56418 RepID=UPI0034CE48FE
MGGWEFDDGTRRDETRRDATLCNTRCNTRRTMRQTRQRQTRLAQFGDGMILNKGFVNRKQKRIVPSSDGEEAESGSGGDRHTVYESEASSDGVLDEAEKEDMSVYLQNCVGNSHCHYSDRHYYSDYADYMQFDYKDGDSVKDSYMYSDSDEHNESSEEDKSIHDRDCEASKYHSDYSSDTQHTNTKTRHTIPSSEWSEQSEQSEQSESEDEFAADEMSERSFEIEIGESSASASLPKPPEFSYNSI